jgi:RHS repeat-associated protein
VLKASNLKPPSGTLDAIYHSEGRVKYTGTTPRYEYTLSDHLGNSRVYHTDLNNDGVGTMVDLLQDNHYYPFGLNHTDPRRNTGCVGVNLYQYNGKELVEDNGLGWNHYGARCYDAAAGRWWVVDPLSSLFVQLTGYNYVKGNPLLFNDPTGMAARTCPSCPQEKRWEDVIGSKDAYVYNAAEDAAYADDSGGKAAENEESKGGSKEENTSSGVPLAVIGMMAEYGQGFIYEAGSNFHSNGWLDFQTGNRYSDRFYGNQHTTTPRLAKNTSRLLNFAGKGLGVIGYVSIVKDYRESIMINPQTQEKALLNLRVEAASNTISTFGGLPGAAWGIGWESGRLITQQPSYRRFVNSIDPDYRKGGNDGLLSTDNDW